jgi:carboxymethylenebutenolidase
MGEPMGELVEFGSNGSTAQGYLATPSAGHGPGVVVLQEWWGLAPQIKRVCDRLAEVGFVALAPDLYHGELAAHDEMDKAGHLMNSMPPDRAARDMSGAVDHLLSLDAVDGDKVGAVGFCMGGMLAFLLAAREGDRVGAAVAFYGAPLGEMAPDWAGLSASVQCHVAERDEFFTSDALHALERELVSAGKSVTLHDYPNTGHGFFNEENALGTYDADAAALAWGRTVTFLRGTLG